jgi:hypothetical protein
MRDSTTEPSGGDEQPAVSCDLQGGTLSVYDDRVEIDRSSASMFGDKTIDAADIRDVEYSGGILTGHIQILEAGVESDEAGRFSHPVDENTLYFPRSKRSCAGRARDAILERAEGV